MVNDIQRTILRCGDWGITAPTMKKDTAVNVRLTSEMRDELQRLANEDGRELAAYIRRILELHVSELRKMDGLPPLRGLSSRFSKD